MPERANRNRAAQQCDISRMCCRISGLLRVWLHNGRSANDLVHDWRDLRRVILVSGADWRRNEVLQSSKSDADKWFTMRNHLCNAHKHLLHWLIRDDRSVLYGMGRSVRSEPLGLAPHGLLGKALLPTAEPRDRIPSFAMLEMKPFGGRCLLCASLWS